EFGAWRAMLRAALRGERDADVPCGSCSACCTSSQFVLIEPDETDALAHIPSELLFPAPRRPIGHVVLGYDERGHCPMLRDGRCSIYEHRPRTCRTYDCRVFAAADVAPAEETKVAITRRVRQWRFRYAGEDDRRAHDALRATAATLQADGVDPGEAAVRAATAGG